MNKRSLFTSIILTVLATSTATISSVSNQPSLDLEHSTNETTVFEGETAYLICRVRDLGKRTLAWVDRELKRILTVGRHTITADGRFSSLINEESTEWTLRIRNVEKRDAGLYTCQLNTDPVVQHDVYLEVSDDVQTIGYDNSGRDDDDGSKGYFSYFVDAVCYYTSLFCRE